MEKIWITIVVTAFGTLLAAVTRHKFILNRKKGDSVMENQKKVKETAIVLQKRYINKTDWTYTPDEHKDELMDFDHVIKDLLKQYKYFWHRKFRNKLLHAYELFKDVDTKPCHPPYYFNEMKAERLADMIDLL